MKSALSEPLDSTRDKLRESKGFTLVELLVVITIIAILSVIGITIFSGVQKSARDAKRRGDIDAIASAMEVHYTNGVYQINDPSWYAANTIPQDSLFGQGNKCGKHTDGTLTACQYCFISDGELDWKWRGQNEAHNGCPIPYGCGGASSCNYYILCANLETPSGAPTAAYPNGTQYYCRFSQQ